MIIYSTWFYIMTTLTSQRLIRGLTFRRIFITYTFAIIKMLMIVIHII